MKKMNKITTYVKRKICEIFYKNNAQSALITPKALNVDNPVQAVGAARGRESRRKHQNSVGVQPLFTPCCAPTEHKVRALHRLTPSCGYRLARGYYLCHAYGVLQKFKNACYISITYKIIFR